MIPEVALYSTEEFLTVLLFYLRVADSPTICVKPLLQSTLGNGQDRVWT
jgi:hypothetical protein